MNKLMILPTDLTRSRGLTVILTANRVQAGITELIANLILHGHLFVIGGGESLPAFELLRLVRRKTLEVKSAQSHLYTVPTASGL